MTTVIRGHYPTEMIGACPHGHIEGICFECLPQEEQQASREMLARFEDDSRFVVAMARAETEIAKGQVIRTTRHGAGLVMPYTFFRKVVDIIHEDRKDRGETDN